MTSRPAPSRPDAPVLVWEAPLRLVNALNAREHWGVRVKRAREQRQVAALLTGQALRDTPVSGPYRILIVRVAVRAFDSDGAWASAKHVRDGIADALSVSDGDETAAEWVVCQETGRGKVAGVRVEIRERGTE